VASCCLVFWAYVYDNLSFVFKGREKVFVNIKTEMNMKLLCLNTWSGRRRKELLSFLETYKDSVDVFCFQEVYNRSPKNLRPIYDKEPDLRLLDSLVSVLGDTHWHIFRSSVSSVWGLAVFVKKDIPVFHEDECFIYKEKGYVPDGDIACGARNMQMISLEYKKTSVHIFHLHGLWDERGKGDTDERLKQSQRIVEYVNLFEGPRILCGDFNMLPNTKSMRLIEEKLHMRNLITENGIMSTRTVLYKKSDKYADYILVGEGIAVEDMAVLTDVVSDHAPLYLDIDFVSRAKL